MDSWPRRRAKPRATEHSLTLLRPNMFDCENIIVVNFQSVPKCMDVKKRSKG